MFESRLPLKNLKNLFWEPIFETHPIRQTVDCSKAELVWSLDQKGFEDSKNLKPQILYPNYFPDPKKGESKKPSKNYCWIIASNYVLSAHQDWINWQLRARENRGKLQLNERAHDSDNLASKESLRKYCKKVKFRTSWSRQHQLNKVGKCVHSHKRTLAGYSELRT